MNCPYCNTPNDSDNRFCVSCGQDMHVAHSNPLTNSGRTLGAQIITLLISLFTISILNSVFTSFDFVQELRIPEFEMQVPFLITMIFYGFAVLLLFNFLRNFNGLWNQAYPLYPEMGHFISALLYLAVFSIAYRALKPLLVMYATDNVPLTLLQVILLLASLFVLIRPMTAVYNVLPAWLARFGRSLSVSTEKKID